MLSIAASALLLAAYLPSASAYYYCNGQYSYNRCNRLSTGARIAIGVVLAIFVLLVIISLAFRRRQVRRSGAAFIPAPPMFRRNNNNVSYPNQNGGVGAGAGPGGFGGPGANGGPQYPPNAHTANSTDVNAPPPAYNAQPKYAPPSAPPPV